MLDAPCCCRTRRARLTRRPLPRPRRRPSPSPSPRTRASSSRPTRSFATASCAVRRRGLRLHCRRAAHAQPGSALPCAGSSRRKGVGQGAAELCPDPLLIPPRPGLEQDMHKIVEEDPIVAAIHKNAEVFDPKTEYSFSYLQARPRRLSHVCSCNRACKQQALQSRCWLLDRRPSSRLLVALLCAGVLGHLRDLLARRGRGRLHGRPADHHLVHRQGQSVPRQPHSNARLYRRIAFRSQLPPSCLTYALQLLVP
jgi:hypothetical protein